MMLDFPLDKPKVEVMGVQRHHTVEVSRQQVRFSLYCYFVVGSLKTEKQLGLQKANQKPKHYPGDTIAH